METTAPLAVGEFFEALLQARRDGDLPADLQPVFSSGAARILELKAKHRQLCESTDELREAANQAKQALDTSSLQLQNLLYEKQHYDKEIATCKGWRSAYSDEQVRRPPVRGCSLLSEKIKRPGTSASLHDVSGTVVICAERGLLQDGATSLACPARFSLLSTSPAAPASCFRSRWCRSPSLPPWKASWPRRQILIS